MTTIKVNNQIITIANKSVENKIEFLDLSKKYNDGSLNLALECMDKMYYEAISTENYNYINDINLYLELGIESFMSLEDGNNNFKTKAKQTLSNILKKLKEIFHKVITSIVNFAKMMVQAFMSLMRKIKQFFIREQFEYHDTITTARTLEYTSPKELIESIKTCDKNKNYISFYVMSSKAGKIRELVAISIPDLAEILFPASELSSKETLNIPSKNNIEKLKDTDFGIPSINDNILNLLDNDFIKYLQENDGDIDGIISKLNSSLQESFDSSELGSKLICNKYELSEYFTSASGFAEYAKSILFTETNQIETMMSGINFISIEYNKTLVRIENIISKMNSIISNNDDPKIISACNKVVTCLNEYRSKLQEHVKIPFEVSKFIYRSQSELNRRLTLNNGIIRLLKKYPLVDNMVASSDMRGHAKLVKLPNMGVQTYAVKFDLETSYDNLNKNDFDFIKRISNEYAHGSSVGFSPIDFGEMKEKEPQSIERLRDIILNNTTIQTKTDDLSAYQMEMRSKNNKVFITGYLVSGNKTSADMKNVDIVYHTSRTRGIKELMPSGASGSSGSGLMFGSKRIYGSLNYPVMPNGMDFMKFQSIIRLMLMGMNAKYKSLLKQYAGDKKRALMDATRKWSDEALKEIGSYFNYTVYIIHKSDIDAAGGKIFADNEHRESRSISDISTGAKINAVYIETDKPIECEEDTARNAKLDKIKFLAKDLYDALTEFGYTKNDVKTM